MRSRAALRDEIGRRAASIVAELSDITERLDTGGAVTPAEIARVTDRIAALRGTIAYTAVLDGAR